MALQMIGVFFSIFFSSTVSLSVYDSEGSMLVFHFPFFLLKPISFSRVRLSKYPFCDMVSAKFSPSGVYSQHCTRGVGRGWYFLDLFSRKYSVLLLFLLAESPLSFSLLFVLPPLTFILNTCLFFSLFISFVGTGKCPGQEPNQTKKRKAPYRLGSGWCRRKD